MDQDQVILFDEGRIRGVGYLITSVLCSLIFLLRETLI